MLCTKDKIKAEPLKISSWNVNGYKSKNIGNKCLDGDFLEEIKNDSFGGVSRNTYIR